MGKTIIKKEDIKGDIEIDIEGNKFVALNPLIGKEDSFIVSFLNGILKITIKDCTIIKSKNLEEFKLKDDFLKEF